MPKYRPMAKSKPVAKPTKPTFPTPYNPFTPGAGVFIRTVTYHAVGRVVGIVQVTPRIAVVQLEQASWVADSGRFGDALAKGTLNEVEFVGTMWVLLDSIVDVFPWNHQVPVLTK